MGKSRKYCVINITCLNPTGLDDGEKIKFDNDDGNSGSIRDDAW